MSNATKTWGAIEVATETYRPTMAHAGPCAPISIVPTNPRVYWSELRSLVHSKPVDMEAVEDLIDLAPLELRHELRVYARANGWKSSKDERLVGEALERSGQGETFEVLEWSGRATLVIDGVEHEISRFTWSDSIGFSAPSLEMELVGPGPPLIIAGPDTIGGVLEYEAGAWDPPSSSTPLEDLEAAMRDLRRSSFIAPFDPEAVMWTGYSREMELVGEEERFDMPITVNPEVEGDFTITFGVVEDE